MKIGIVILNFNTYQLTKNCVESIFNYTKVVKDYRIYIVDNKSSDDSAQLLAEEYKNDERVELLYSSESLGNSEGWNIGARKAVKDGVDCVLFLDSDTEMINDAVTIMSEHLSPDDVAVTGPALYDFNGNYIQYAGRLYTGVTRLYPMKVIGKILTFFTHKKRRIYYDINQDFRYQGLFSGCCMCIKTSFLLKIGFLDENVKFYHEEDILGHQLHQNDLYSCICSEAKVKHLCGATTKKNNQNGANAFRRLYSWSGALYVLREYAKTPFLVRKLIAIEYYIFWAVLCLIHKEYRQKNKLFLQEMKKANKKEKKQ